MMVYSMAAVIDCGKYYEVQYLTTSLNKDFERNHKFLGLGQMAASEIKKAIDNGQIVRINSNYQNVDVQPFDLLIVDKNSNKLKDDKKILVMKARQLITHQQANVSGLMMYEYININNTLCDKGFFIHDDNKEEVYLKILETGDEKLIDKLERYLNARDVISRSGFLEEKYSKFYNDMEEALTEEAATEIYSNFVIEFQSFIT